MPPIVAALFVGGLTYFGRIARKESLSIKTVVGIGGLALALTMIEQVDEDLAKKFGVLAVVGTMLAHWEVIVKASGLGGK